MEENKKIDIIQVIPTLGIGGAEIVVENLVRELKNKQYNVLVVTFFSNETFISERIKNLGIPIIYLDKKLGFDISIMRKLFDIFSKYKPKVVHSHLSATLYCLPIEVLLGIKSRIHTTHNLAEKDAGIFSKILYRIFFKLFKLIPVAISEKVKSSISKVYHVDSSHIPLIYNGVLLADFNRKSNYEITKNIEIVHVGRLSEPKNHVTMIKAVQILKTKYPNLTLKLIGQGEKQEELSELVETLGLEKNIIFVGAVDDVRNFLLEADIFILPSLWEGMPISLIEAMATGLPIIASDVGGIGEMISHEESGLLIEPDTDALVDSINSLIESQWLRECLGNNAYIKSLDFTSDIMAEKYIELYRKGE
ncbi:glycosyltransferase [Granulicatella seriolae]|uniref:Glycosyltransferase n=1 Tax=Granulicatella seriolae TaxID=2967226 RepID=A0ABT1WPL0_9LACT|nr:glycosyltransferase [Granulicatella seriolae]